MWQNGTIKSYIYLCLSEGKRQTYIRPLWSSQLLPTLLLLCPWSPFIPFNSDTRDLPPRKCSELNALGMCHEREMDKQTYGYRSWQEGVQGKLSFLVFLYRNSSTNLTETRSLTMHNKPPSEGSEWHSGERSRGSFCHTLPTSHLENTLKWKAYGSRSCGQSCREPKKTAKAASSISYPERDSVSFLAARIRVVKPLREQPLHPPCGLETQMEAACAACLMSCPRTRRELCPAPAKRPNLALIWLI